MDELSTSNDDLIQHAQFLEEEQLNLKVIGTALDTCPPGSHACVTTV